MVILSPLLQDKEEGGGHNTVSKNVNIRKDSMCNEMTFWKLFRDLNENMNKLQHFSCSNID